MSLRYAVKFPWNGVLRYGVFVKNMPGGNSIVADAVLPTEYRVSSTTLTDVSDEEYDRYVDSAFRQAQADAAKTEGVAPGALFSVFVADGQAFYVVTKVTKTRATIEWRGFGLDRYRDHFFGNGRSLPIKDVARYVLPAQGRLPRER